jgi:hypothetical protein
VLLALISKRELNRNQGNRNHTAEGAKAILWIDNLRGVEARLTGSRSGLPGATEGRHLDRAPMPETAHPPVFGEQAWNTARGIDEVLNSFWNCMAISCKARLVRRLC